MTRKEAIEVANSRPRGYDLQWGVYKSNNEYVIAPASFMKRHPDMDYIYITKGKYCGDNYKEVSK